MRNVNNEKSGNSLSSLGRKRQGATIVVLAAVILAVLAASYGVVELIERRAHSGAEKLVSDVVEHIDDKMNEVKLATREASETAYGQIDNPEELISLVRDFVVNNEFVYGSTVAFEPDAFPEYGRCFAPYSWRTSNGEVHSRQLGTETDYYEEEWYKETKLSGQEYWCEPYFDEGGAKIMMCTFSVPLIGDDGNLIAIMTADVGLEDLEAYTLSINPYDDSYIMLRSKKGLPLVNTELESDGENDDIIIKGITEVGWSVELMIPFTYLMRGDTGILFLIGGIILVTLALVYFINRLLTGMQQRASAEYLSVIDAISDSFSSIYLVNLLTDETIVFRDPENYSPIIAELGEEEQSFSERMGVLLKYDCCIPDRERMLREVSPAAIFGNLSIQDKYEVRFRKIINGELCWYEMNVFAVEYDSEGAPVRAVVAFTNVNENVQKEKRTQDTLEQALVAARSANKAKTTFLFNMSHDIRTPMNAILGYTDMAIRHNEETNTVMDCLHKIKASGNHLLSLINDILEMSRIEAGKLELSNEPIDIRTAITNTEHMSRALAIPKSIDFAMEIGKINNPYVYSDELHINEVFINIISNAMKYSKEDGTVKFRIEQVSGVMENGKARYCFEVEDDGIGMSEDFQKHIFENFSREKSTTVSKQEGAGLGLSIVKRIVDMAGGTIDIKSKLGEGTTVTVILPFTVMSPDEINVFIKEQDGTGEYDEETILKGKRLLLVEDNEMNREIAEELLTEEGLIVETAEDGSRAVEVVSEKGTDYYDYILMDIQMPEMNGYEATQVIRQLPNGDRVPIIAVSANAFDEDRKKSLKAGMNEHIAKPIDINKLKNALIAHSV